MMKFIEDMKNRVIMLDKEVHHMRSVILDKEKTNVCGICGAQDPYIEYKQREGVHFIWCNKCHTISFFKKPQSEEKRN